MRKSLILLFFCVQHFVLRSQDTFSILAFDSITGEVGGAGASCIDLFNYPGITNDFIIELLPGEGAIATQAAYLSSNQVNARNEFVNGLTPDSLISWLIANDYGGNPHIRQYGVVRMVTGANRAAAFTGTACMNYKNHIVGPNYTIHGNILLGQKVLDSIEARFLREPGDLACKLMAGLQGAKMIGADSRCAPNNSSSLFAFIKVAQPTDTFYDPSFILSLKTHSNAMIEPIDSLQKMFDVARTCTVNTTGLHAGAGLPYTLKVYPNPAAHEIKIKTGNSAEVNCEIMDVYGKVVYTTLVRLEKTIDVSRWEKGIYFIRTRSQKGILTQKIIIN
jgi:uncharacterized Ntn-hydrolase superfamily protein